jgi:hypothetical protein
MEDIRVNLELYTPIRLCIYYGMAKLPFELQDFLGDSAGASSASFPSPRHQSLVGK